VPACTSLGCKTDSWAKPPADAWPKDYKVADHGADHDVDGTQKNSAAAEGKLGAWVPKQDENGKYVVPKEEADFKLAGTQSDVRLGATSDPICSSAGCTQYKHPSKDGHKMNYFVADFGKDHDVKASEDSAEKAEATLGHTFTPKYDEEKDEWVVPTAEAEFRLAGVEADLRVGKHKHPSDPACTSGGWCGESLWPEGRAKKEEHDVLRTDTRKGANQAPTEEEAHANLDRAVKARPDPHPSTEEPETEEQAAASAAREAHLEAVAANTPDASASRKTSSMVKDLEWAASHSNAQQKHQSLAECQGDDDTCSQRKKSGFVADEEWQKCHSGA